MGDNPDQYETQICTNPITGEPAVAIAHKQEGGCVYLGEHGCTIHDRAPALCRKFDCRKFYLKLVEQTTRPERRRLIRKGLISNQLLLEGRKRVATLKNDREQ